MAFGYKTSPSLDLHHREAAKHVPNTAWLYTSSLLTKPGIHMRSIPCPAASIVPCTALHLFMERNQQTNVIIKAVKRRFKGTK